MTPDQISQLWNLDSDKQYLLTNDFISGTYFYLASLYSVNSLNDYAHAANDLINSYHLTLDNAASIGQTLPAFLTFKSNYPEYFI
jgi:hypothetical protein